MTEVDPEKILVELERMRVNAAARQCGYSGRHPVLMATTLLILATGAFALWVLSLLIEGMPGPKTKAPAQVPAMMEVQERTS